MFDRLIASRRRPDMRRGSAASVLALSLHATLIAGAVYATLAAEEPPPDVTPVDIGPYVSAARPEPPTPLTPVAAPVSGLPIIDPPAVVPADLPAPDLGVALDPTAHRDWHVGGGRGTAEGSARDGVYSARVVEESPVLLSGPPLAYPELLRQARIQGRVEVEAVIDATGRAEAGTVTVVRSPHPGFEAPAREFVRRALFRPGRMHGRAVRVLVRLPIEFALR